MARHKKFSGGTKLADFEPLTFELNDHEFTALAAIQGSVILEFVAAADGDGGDSARALYKFLQDSMPETEYKRLDKVLHDPETIIDIALIGDIVSWLIEEYSSRPTQRPETSLNGPSSSGPTSTVEDSSTESV